MSFRNLRNRKISGSGGKGGGEGAERAAFARMLWSAFPEARSEHELCELAAMVLTDDARPVNPRTVRNWLQCENAPHFRYVVRVMALAGAEAVFALIDPEAAS
ncbi:hypothetical protein SAMN06273572_10228 [Monaibacterium marinum]|uniref:Uncharacterized protein n=1 Tax=Pontivivens marinum TaxID=1690039 RepID=A0A2C9CQ18_9RHOB|nr:hypothetical protein [Monaibacterium marinum]SOH93352.1 hypothetical protein SAMN06273572_10228 [Monaibacterium marinum]